MRYKPRVWMKKDIKIKNQVIGYIQLVNYLLGKNCVAQIEYELEEPYHNKGIMSKELPKYLKSCKKREEKYTNDLVSKRLRCHRLLAVVKKDNLASIRVLEKNGFVKFKEHGEEILYITHLDFKVQDVLKALDYFTHQGARFNENTA